MKVPAIPHEHKWKRIVAYVKKEKKKHEERRREWLVSYLAPPSQIVNLDGRDYLIADSNFETCCVAAFLSTRILRFHPCILYTRSSNTGSYTLAKQSTA